MLTTGITVSSRNGHVGSIEDMVNMFYSCKVDIGFTVNLLPIGWHVYVAGPGQ